MTFNGPASGVMVLLWLLVMGAILIHAILSQGRNPELDRKIRSNRKVFRARERWLAENLGGVSYGPYQGELLNSLRAVLLTDGAWSALDGYSESSLGQLIDRKVRNELWEPRVDRAELIAAVRSVGHDWQAAVGSLKLDPVSIRGL